MRECNRCGVPQSPEQFAKGRARYTCKPCWNEFQREYRASRTRFKAYGISRAEYLKMTKAQGGRCAICRERETALNTNGSGEVADLTIDHCHNSGEVRGLLCRRCNLGLGHFKDDVTAMRAAIEYLESA